MLSFDIPNYNKFRSNAGQRIGKLNIDRKQLSLINKFSILYLRACTWPQVLKQRIIYFPSSITLANIYLFSSIISWIIL